jgi:hypothetical protein
VTLSNPLHLDPENPRDEASSRRVRRERLLRVGRRVGVGAGWVAVVLAGVTLLYLVSMNVFLRTRLFRDAITADSGALRVEYASAYSPWPGQIHADGLAIRGRDSSVEWLLAIDHCDFRESFLDLVRRRFHASHVRGDGLSLRLRQRLQEVTPAASALPPVPGFLDPPRAEVGPRPPPLTDADYRLWSIELDDVVAEHVREVWIDAARATGNVRMEGRWFFRPLRRLEVGPAAIDLRSVNLLHGADAPLALDLHGTMMVTIHPVDMRDAGAGAIVDHLALDADLSGALRGAALIDHLGGSGGKGLLAAWAIEPAAAHVVADHTASTVTLDIPEAALESREPMRALLPLPDGLDLEAKRATASIHAVVDIAARSAAGHVAIVAPTLTLQTGDETLTGVFKLDLEAKARNSVVDLSGTTAAFTAGPPGRPGARGDERASGWWVRVALADARLAFGGGAPRFRALTLATAKDASPVSAFLAKVTPLPRWLIDAVPTNDLRVEGEIQARPSVFEVRSVKARSEGSSVDFEFERLASWKEWAMLLEAGPVHAGVRSGDGGTEVVLFNAQPWFEAQTAAFRTNASRER